MPPARIAATVLAMATLLAACGNQSPDPSADGGQTEEVPVQAADSTPVATPEPTLRMSTGVCPSERENAGLEYEFDMDKMLRMDAIDKFCGPVPVSSWETGYEVDELTDTLTLYVWTIATTHDLQVSGQAPTLLFACESGAGRIWDLRIEAWLGTYVSEQYGIGVPVAYRFDDRPIIRQNWKDDVDDYSALLKNDQTKMREFVNSVLDADKLVFRAWQYDESEIGTMTFDLVGAEQDVLPVLRECGY